MKLLYPFKRFRTLLAALAVLATTLSLPGVSGPAARISSSTNHGGAVITGSPTVIINGSGAARIGDTCTCPLNSGFPAFIPHVGGPITTGSGSVFINGVAAATNGSTVIEVGAVSTITGGSPTVIIGP